MMKNRKKQQKTNERKRNKKSLLLQDKNLKLLHVLNVHAVD